MLLLLTEKKKNLPPDAGLDATSLYLDFIFPRIKGGRERERERRHLGDIQRTFLCFSRTSDFVDILISFLPSHSHSLLPPHSPTWE